MEDSERERYRYFLRDSIRKKIDFLRTAQSRGLPAPAAQKPVRRAQNLIKLPKPGNFIPGHCREIDKVFAARESRRNFSDEPLELAELSFLLWACQGVRKILGTGVTLRTVPSAGARHALETYLAVRQVSDLQPGIYRYLPLDHQLVFEHRVGSLAQKLSLACFRQQFCANSAVTFIWSAIPERMEWRYDLAAHKVIAIDCGHVCQNLYLAAESVGLGLCAVAAYDQERIDRLLKIDGENEFVIYLAAAGRKKAEKISG